MPEVALAVVSWNTREHLRACLESLAGEAAAGRLEAWVVDNGSTDGSPELVREEFGWARLVEPGANVGYGAAVNLVAERTSTPWLAAANADVALEAGALDALLAAGAADPQAGALAPRLVAPDGSTQHGVHAFPTVASTAAFDLALHRLVPGLGERLCLPSRWDPDRERRVDWAVGAFLLLRRAAWDAAGGFDPAQWLYAEDLDLGWRLAHAGWATRYVPGARVRHAESAATAAAWGAARDERRQAATYAWIARRRGRAAMRAVALLNVAGAAARWALWTPLARARPDPWAWRRASMARWARLHARTGLGRTADPGGPAGTLAA